MYYRLQVFGWGFLVVVVVVVVVFVVVVVVVCLYFVSPEIIVMVCWT